MSSTYYLAIKCSYNLFFSSEPKIEIKMRKQNKICGKYVGNMWEICGKYVGNMWEICGKYVGNMWVCGKYVGNMWEICGKYVGNMWET